jgi:hypothetical protein
MTTTSTNTLGVDLGLWQAGLRLKVFVDHIDTYQDETRRRLATVELAPADRAFFALIRQPVYVLALTEGWCGDSLMNLPILARIVEAAPGFRLRVFVRGEWPELAAAYAERGVQNIPVFTFFNEAFGEIGTWVERSQAAHERVAQWRAENPAYERIRSDPTLSQSEKRLLLAPVLGPLRVQMEQWYADSLQAATVAEIKTLLAAHT